MTKIQLLSRLDEMVWLPPDWDGFGTGAISFKAYSVASQIVEWSHDKYNLNLFVAIEPEGGLEGTLIYRKKCWEFSIHPTKGIIEYEEWNDNSVSYGAFIPSKQDFLALIEGN